MRNNPNNSEVFDAYEKLAKDLGLIKNAADKESPELRKYKDSAYPRMDSNDISAIELLYGVKPDSAVKYDSDEVGGIMMAAHPEPVIIAPSYDRVNGLVENEAERQRININIALGPNSSNETQGPKMAADEMVMELIRVANDLDNQGFEGLRVLADECLEEMVKEAAKKKLDPKAKIRNRGTCVFPAGKGKNKSEKDHYPINTEEQAKTALRYAGKQKSAPWYSGSVEEMRKTVQRAVYRKYPGLKKRHQEREKKSSDIQPRITKIANETCKACGHPKKEHHEFRSGTAGACDHKTSGERFGDECECLGFEKNKEKNEIDHITYCDNYTMHDRDCDCAVTKIALIDGEEMPLHWR